MAKTPANRRKRAQTEDAIHAGMSFGEQLRWHFTAETRGDDETGAWTASKFGEAVGRSDAAVRFWLRDKTAPDDLITIERVLFGNKSEYAEYRVLLRRAHERLKRDLAAARSKTPDEPDLPPAPLRWIGREAEQAALVAALLAGGEAVSVLVWGGPGMGKTSLTVMAARDQRVAERFGARRWLSLIHI